MLGWIAVQSERIRTRTKKFWGWLVSDRLFVFVLVIFFSLVILGVLLWWNWVYIWEWAKNHDSEILRNWVLILLGSIGLPLATWRSIVAQKQAQISERGLLNERYQKGAEMLGSKTLATRMGGIYALERLAREHPNEYHLQIMDLLCAFIRHPTEKDKNLEDGDGGKSGIPNETESPKCPLDVKAAALAIGRRKMRQIRIENKEEDWHLDLRNANLSGVTLITPDGINFEGALLIGANLLGASLVGAKLSNAHFMSANLSNANLSGTHLSQVELYKANLSSSKLIGSMNLTQYQLNRGYIWEGEQSPDLHHAFCKDTGKLLIWENEPRPKPETDEQR